MCAHAHPHKYRQFIREKASCVYAAEERFVVHFFARPLYTAYGRAGFDSISAGRWSLCIDPLSLSLSFSLALSVKFIPALNNAVFGKSASVHGRVMYVANAELPIFEKHIVAQEVKPCHGRFMTADGVATAKASKWFFSQHPRSTKAASVHREWVVWWVCCICDVLLH